MPDYLATKYAEVTDELLDGWRRARRVGAAPALGRILGDCHRGNILWTDLGPHFVDLDDCLTGPAIQDLWMLLAGGQQEMRTELQDLLKGYEQFLPFDRREIALDRTAARIAHDSLLRMAGAALARSGLSEGFSVVCRAALLGAALPRARRSAGGGARAAARVVTRYGGVVIGGVFGDDRNMAGTNEDHDAPSCCCSARRRRWRLSSRTQARRCGRPRHRSKPKAPVAPKPGATAAEQTAGMVEAASSGQIASCRSQLKFDLAQRPKVGQPLDINLALIAQIDAQSGDDPGDGRR